jgi:hypothetical protein
MQGKYANYPKYLTARLQRGLLRASIRRLLAWEALDDPKPGFSIVIACSAEFPRMLIGNFRFLARQDLTGLDQTIVAFDGPPSETLDAFEREANAAFPQLKLMCLHQTEREAAMLKRIAWGWVDCWLSYAKGLASVRTRSVMLHDMDAYLIRPNLVADRFAAFQSRGDAFMGIRWYQGNGVEEKDRLAYIVEMWLDAQHLRRHFKPINLFNHVTMFEGRSVDFDTLLYPQVVLGSRSVMELSEEHWVHPSQVISQYTYLRRGGVYAAPATNNLFWIPYFMYLSDDREIFERHLAPLRNANGRPIEFLGGKMDASKLSRVHFDWIAKQMHRTESAAFGGMRPEVRGYLDAIEQLIADERS